MSIIEIVNYGLYTIPLVITFIFFFSSWFLSQRMIQYNVLDSATGNFYYSLSFIKPFTWFIDDEQDWKRKAKLETMLREANMDKIFNYRAFAAMQWFYMLIAFGVWVFLFITFNMWISILEALLSVPIQSTPETLLLIKCGLFSFVLITGYLPGMFIKSRAKKAMMNFLEGVPLLQLALILLLRANRPVNEIMYELAKMETNYKNIFEKAYNIFIRDKDAGFDYLLDKFKGTGFDDSLLILREIALYSREGTVQVLQNNLEVIDIKIAQIKREKALLGNLIGNLSIAMPFVAVIMLGIVPIIIFAVNLLSQASVNI